MFDRFFSRERKPRRNAAPNTRPRAPPQPQISTSTALARRTPSIILEEEEDVLSELPHLQHINSPRASMSSLPSYRSRDTDLPNYKYETGHPLFTLDFLNTQALAARPAAVARRPRRAPRPDPALCLAPYSAPGSPFRDVQMSFGWMWMPTRGKKYRGKLIPHDHPVYSMSPSEQARLRRMGIDPVGKAEFMALQTS